MPSTRITLVPHSPAHFRALVEGADAYERHFGLQLADGLRDMAIGPEISAEFRARIESATETDPWRDGFGIVETAERVVIGACGCKGPPDADGAVEIAYGIAPAYQGRGYATEAAQALMAWASADDRVRVLRAHTLAERNASTSVLGKCGFAFVGEVTDPEDGVVWRWERGKVEAAGSGR
jgi:RimJ/RimL family protein N-acetyltransferase